MVVTMLEHFQLNSCIEILKNERPVFFSEADFQMSLARLITESNPSIKVMLEYPYYVDPENIENSLIQYFDIILIDEVSFVVIELKYRQKKLKEVYTDSYTGLPLYLKEHSAQDQGCFQFWNDIHRIENARFRETISGKKFEKGYSLMLTNDPSYWNKPTKNKTSYDAFQLYDGRELVKNTELAFRKGTAKSSNGDKKFIIRGDYSISWEDYSSLFPSEASKKNGIFRYLLLEIKP